MPTDFLIPEAQPSHTDTPKKETRYVSRILFLAILLIIILAFRFHMPHFPVGTLHVVGYQNIQQAIESHSGLRCLYSLINPNLRKRQETIQEILAILEKYETGLARVTKEDLAEVIYEEATRHNYDPKLIVALIAIESSFQNWSVSEKGAKGLMQMMPYVAESVAPELGIEWSGDRTLFNPFLNIKMGVYYFSRLLSDFKDLGLALTAYNYGPTYVKSLIERRRKIPKDFHQKILTIYHDLLISPSREVPPLADDGQLIDIIT